MKMKKCYFPGEVRDEGVPPQYRPGGQCLLEHPQRGLEACSHHQLHSLWAPIPFLGESVREF